MDEARSSRAAQDARVKAIEGRRRTMGIGIITEERWTKTRDFLVEPAC